MNDVPSQFTAVETPLEAHRLYDTDVTAKLAAVAESTVRRHCRDGTLKAFAHGRRWKIPHEALVKYLQRNPNGSPK